MTWFELVEAIVVAQCIGGLLRYALSVAISSHHRRKWSKTSSQPLQPDQLGHAAHYDGQSQANTNVYAGQY